MTGPEMLIRQALKFLGLTGEKIETAVLQIGADVSNFRNQLAGIEHRLDLLLRAHGIDAKQLNGADKSQTNPPKLPAPENPPVQ